MSNRSLLFLSHRIPFPPDKGEKIRAYRLLDHLAKTFRVSLGCFIDDKNDWAHAKALDAICAETFYTALPPGVAKINALRGLVTGLPLSIAAFSNTKMRQWVEE